MELKVRVDAISKHEGVLDEILTIWLEQLDAARTLQLGIVDAASAAETSGSRYFGSYHEEWMTWHRAVEHHDWSHYSRQRHMRVRGPYWGTFLGTELAEIADPDKTLVARFLQLSEDSGYAPQFARAFPSGAVFLAVSASPLELLNRSIVPPSWAISNAAWLKNELRQHGLV